jgi:hypothetical protein
MPTSTILRLSRVLRMVSIAAGSAMSAATVSATAPGTHCSRVALAASSFCWLRDTRTTLRPWRASSVAYARPMPSLPPVTMAHSP